MQCHDHPLTASKQDKLMTMKTVVRKFSKFNEHHESASHKAAVKKVLAELAQPQPMTRHITVTPVDVLV